MFLIGWLILSIVFVMGWILRGVFIMREDEMKTFEDYKRYQDWKG